MVKCIKIILSVLILAGILILGLAFVPKFNLLVDSKIQYFGNLNSAYDYLTTFAPEKSEKDGGQKEKALNASEVGFKEILDVLKQRSEKLKGVKVDQITNRRENALSNSTGSAVVLLNVVFVRSSNNFPPYIAITSESELADWIKNYKRHWILLVGLSFVFVGGFARLLFFTHRLNSKKLLTIVLIAFFLLIMLLLAFGAISWKDFLGYFWAIPLTIVALFQDWIKRKIFAPNIDIEFKLQPPFCLETKVLNSETRQVRPAHYFRFKVKNIGDVQAKWCECVAEKLWIFKDNEWKEDVNFQPINLAWSNNKTQTSFLDINPGPRGWFCDLVHIDGWNKKLYFDYRQPIPFSQYIEIQNNIRHRLKVVVEGE